LVICPDAALATVPFAALPGRAPGGRLSDDFRLAFVSMAQDLVPRERGVQGGGVLALGAVDYDRAATTGGPSVGAERLLVAASSRAPRGGAFLALPATKSEAEVSRAAVGGASVLLTEAEATEARVRAECKGRRVLHLATHGFVRDDLMHGLFPTAGSKGLGLDATLERHVAGGHDPMLLSGLALAGANPREGGLGDDGVLTALEASHLDLDGCELAVLSACQTALGHAEAGEGVVGLVQAFRMAGARQVLGSLWKVDDEATRALMTEFYRLWSPTDATPGVSAAEALRRAQDFVRAEKKWTRPYFWAAWVLWGVP
jgi:CHAT domain-containing protein